MTLYESNYIRLSWLLPDIRTLSGSHVSLTPGDPDLYLDITEHCPYTTLLNLSYRLGTPAGTLHIPDMQLRVYHDARLAEAVSCTDSPAHAPLRELQDVLKLQFDRELKGRWARNVLLNKWLEYCTERGHRFQTPVLPSSGPSSQDQR